MIYGRLNPKSGAMRVFQAPRGTGPYGIATTPNGQVWYASLAGSHVARIDLRTGKATVAAPADARPGRAAHLVRLARAAVGERVERGQGRALRPRHAEAGASGASPGAAQPYAVYVDEQDIVWLTDFGRSALVRFDPATARFTTFRLRAGADVRQLLGRPGEVWGAESGADRLVVVRTT